MEVVVVVLVMVVVVVVVVVMVVPVVLQYKLKTFNSLFGNILSVISAEWCAAAKTGFVFYCTK